MNRVKTNVTFESRLTDSRPFEARKCCDAESQLEIREMRLGDIPAVLPIEVASFEHPWGQADYVRTLYLANSCGYVANIGERMVGFALYETQGDQLHLLNLAVNPAHRRQGIGRRLIYALIGRMALERCATLTLEVRETNLNALCFYRSLGFLATAILPRYYSYRLPQTGHEDAYRLELRVPLQSSRHSAKSHAENG